MALRVLTASASSSAGGTWDTATSNSGVHNSTDIAVLTTPTNSAVFTAPNTTNAATGVWIFPTVLGSGTLTATLREAGVDKASVTVNVSDLTINEWNYLSLGTPYVFTTTVASSYRWVFNTSVAGTSVASANVGGTLIAYISTDNRNTALGATDDLWIPKRLTGAGTSTAVTWTIDSDVSFGGSGNANALTTARINNAQFALYIAPGATMTFDTSASRTMTIAGSAWVGGGLNIGSTASPVPEANTITLSINQGGTNGNYGWGFGASPTVVVQGAPKKSTSAWYASMVSGTGTAASPVTLSADIGSVGDELVFHATEAIGETEYRFIRTKPSSTTYELATTSGGAEAALTNTHDTNCEVVNISRNVIFKTTNNSHGLYMNFWSGSSASHDWDWYRVENISGVGTSNKSQVQYATTGSSPGNFDYFVHYRTIGTSSVPFSNPSSFNTTHTGGVFVRNDATASTFQVNVATSKTFNDFFLLGGNINTFINGAASVFFNSLRFWDTGAGFAPSFSNSIEWTNAKIQGVGGSSSAIVLAGAGSSSGLVFRNCQIGNIIANTNGDVAGLANKFSTALFDNCIFSTSTPVINATPSAITTMAQGTEVRYHRYNQTDGKHYWITPTATNQSTGAELADTYTRTVGNYALKMAPSDEDIGSTWEFLVPARVGQAVSALGFIKLNSDFIGDASATCVVELFLPGSTTADYTQVMSKSTTDEQVFIVYSDYDQPVDRLATVRVTAKSNTADAAAYVSDIFNGTNTITGLRTWYQGKPSSIMFEQLGDAAAVWAVATATLTSAGTTGKQVKDALTVGKFLGLK